MMTARHRLLRTAIGCCGVILAAVPATGVLAAGCTREVQGEGMVDSVIDARTIRLQDGRDIRLTAIEPIPGRRRSATAALTRIVSGQQVTLHGDSDAPDRYGRQPALVFVDNAAPVQSQLLARGEAVVAADIAIGECRTELLAAEAEARRGRQGYWADPAALKNAENSGDILARIGQFAVVEGRVVSVREAGSTRYLNFGRRWTRDFAVTISRRMGTTFEAAGIALKSLEHKRIRVRGWVEQRGGPRIEIRQIGQIELLGDN